MLEVIFGSLGVVSVAGFVWLVRLSKASKINRQKRVTAIRESVIDPTRQFNDPWLGTSCSNRSLSKHERRLRDAQTIDHLPGASCSFGAHE